MKIIAIALIFAALVAIPAWAQNPPGSGKTSELKAGGLAEGQRLFEKKEYGRAFDILLPLANTGNPEAQYLVAVAYFEGYVKPEHDNRALELFLASAQAGHKKSRQSIIGLMINWMGRRFGNGENDCEYIDRVSKWSSPRTFFEKANDKDKGFERESATVSLAWMIIAAEKEHWKAQVAAPVRRLLIGQRRRDTADQLAKLWLSGELFDWAYEILNGC